MTILIRGRNSVTSDKVFALKRCVYREPENPHFLLTTDFITRRVYTASVNEFNRQPLCSFMMISKRVS